MKTPSGKLNNYYPLKHWLITLAIAPLLMIVYNLTEVGSTSYIEFYAFVFLCSFLFSIPGFLIYNALFHLIAKNKMPVYVIKITLSLCAMGIGLATLLFIERSLIDFVAFYAIAAVISSFFLKIYKSEEPLPIEENEHTLS